MTKKEFLQHCHYYNGEGDNPYDVENQRNFYTFWQLEKQCAEMIAAIPDYLLPFIEDAKALEARQPSVFGKTRTKNLTPEAKGIMLFIECMVTKWNPYVDRDFIFDY